MHFYLNLTQSRIHWNNKASLGKILVYKSNVNLWCYFNIRSLVDKFFVFLFCLCMCKNKWFSNVDTFPWENTFDLEAFNMQKIYIGLMLWMTSCVIFELLLNSTAEKYTLGVWVFMLCTSFLYHIWHLARHFIFLLLFSLYLLFWKGVLWDYLDSCTIRNLGGKSRWSHFSGP